ncbi:MAG TPA: T9SS type A sorting domain-containing protein [Aequorivita sp.]|nr:T9SS type A sorting domain-containing protein [Aequorivita sp.]
MKKIYLLALTLGAFAFSANAQIINDDIESYSLGPLFEDHWSSWSGAAGPDNAVVTDELANSGSQSIFIGGDGVQDALLLLGNQTSGNYELTFLMYIPTDKTGYINFQGETENGGAGAGGGGVFNSGNITFNLDGLSPGIVEDIDADGTVNNTYSYPQNFWFEVKFEFDLSGPTYTLSIDGTAGAPVAFGQDSTVGGIDFFSIDANNEYYVDDVLFTDGASTQDFSADSFRVYPNPVKDILNISTKTAVDNVTVYDILGKTVLTSNPDVISPKIDMSGLASGAYLVQVTIGNASKTVKVLK